MVDNFHNYSNKQNKTDNTDYNSLVLKERFEVRTRQILYKVKETDTLKGRIDLNRDNADLVF